MFWGIGYKQTTFTWSRFLLFLDLHYLPSTGIPNYKKAALWWFIGNHGLFSTRREESISDEGGADGGRLQQNWV